MTSPEQQTRQRSAIFQALGFAWDFGIVVVGPLVVLGVAGRLLDKHFGTTPWLFLTGFVVSIAASTFLLITRLKKIIAKTLNQKSPKV